VGLLDHTGDRSGQLGLADDPDQSSIGVHDGRRRGHVPVQQSGRPHAAAMSGRTLTAGEVITSLTIMIGQLLSVLRGESGQGFG
jgi:hypothetical protein